MSDLHQKIDRILRLNEALAAVVDTVKRNIATIGQTVMTTAQQVTNLTDAVTDMAANQAKLADNLKASDAAIQAEIAALQTAIGASGGTADPAVQAAIDNIKTISASTATAAQGVADDTAKLVASLPPPPPAPAA